MNRKEEYDLLIQQLEETPAALEYTTTRLSARIKKHRWHQWIGIPIGSLLSFFIVFVILVNSVPIFAKGCSQIPVIKELAQLVDFSPSLTKAVENEYIQTIEVEQTKGDMTAKVEYLIVDQKQVNIFYRINTANGHLMDIALDVKSMQSEQLECAFSAGSSEIESGELKQCTIDFADKDVPGQFKFIMEVYDEGIESEEERVFEVKEEEDNRIHEIEDYYAGRKPSQTFEFDLTFDPKYTAQGEKIALDETIQLENQEFKLSNIEIYPTHMRFNVKGLEENTAYLAELSYYIENERGERFDKITNGVTAMGSDNTPDGIDYRAESSFFSNSQSLTLYITGAKWLDKDKQKVKLDLVHQTADYLPEGVTFEKAIRKENGWELIFSATKYEEDSMYQVWDMNYYDKAGTEQRINFWSTTTCYIDEVTGEELRDDSKFYNQLPLLNYMEDEVYMGLNFSRRTVFEEPIVIKLK